LVFLSLKNSANETVFAEKALEMVKANCTGKTKCVLSTTLLEEPLIKSREIKNYTDLSCVNITHRCALPGNRNSFWFD